MEGDMAAAVKVTASVIASATYARFASSSMKPGKLRLLSLLPVIALFNCLPFLFTSINLRVAASFALTWLAVFKLLLLAFGVGPLYPSLPLSAFIAVSSLPIKIQPKAQPSPFQSLRLFSLSCIKFVLISLLGFIYQSHPGLLPVICGLYLYLFLELILGCAALLAGSLLDLGLEPYFNAPYESASLQDFWGRRWNLMITDILRPSVYHPIKSRFGTSAAFMAVFFVSGVMHEVIFSHVSLQLPTGEVTLFFIIHGLCTALEVKAKKAGWARLHPAVAVPLTLAFVMSTGFWLFFPQLLRGGWADDGLAEFTAVIKGGPAVWSRMS